MTATQGEILDHLTRAQQSLQICSTVILNDAFTPEQATVLFRQAESAMMRLRVVKDWLEHFGE